MYRDSGAPPPIQHDYAVEDAVDLLCARFALWTRRIDRVGVVMGIAVGLGALWITRDDPSWGMRKLL